MIRNTSAESFKAIRESGVLSLRRLQVYEILFDHGPMTGSELALRFQKLHGSRTPNQANVVTRLGELRDMGVAEEIRTRRCSVTGMNVIEWDLNDRLPKPLKKTGARRSVWAEFDLFGEIRRTSTEPFVGGIEFVERRSNGNRAR